MMPAKSLQKATSCLAQVQEVRAELAPWDKKIAEAESQVKLATTERDLVTQQQQEARKRLQVLPSSHLAPLLSLAHCSLYPLSEGRTCTPFV